MTPPLQRILRYLPALEKLHEGKATISTAHFIVSLDKLTPDTVREDFAEMGMTLDPRSNLDVDRAYWTVVQCQTSAEYELKKSGNMQLLVPTEADLQASLESIHSSEAANRRPSWSGPEAARMVEVAFDATESLDLFLLGHGRMSDGHVAFRHQLETAKRVLEEMHGVAIVADEVGLGKTNIAGLILEEVLAHKPNASVLILVPPNLRKQWVKDELPEFFHRNVKSDLDTKLSLSEIAKERILLFSLDQAKGNGKDDALSRTLRERVWDLLIIDEAHDCRNADRLRFRFVYSLPALRRVFLTATPMHNSGYDIYNLVNLLTPGSLGQRRFFAERHMAGKRLLKDSDALQQDIKPLLTRTLRRDTGIRFAERDFSLIKITAFKHEETELYDELLNLLRGVYKRHMGVAAQVAQPSGQPQYVSQFVLIAMLVLREMASHPLAAIHTLKTALRKQVAEFASITRDDSDLARLDAFIERYAGHSWDVAHHAKSERLLKEARRLLSDGKKFVIYVNYLETLKELAKMLAKQNRDARILSYEGSMGTDLKTEATTAFKEEAKACMVSTDSGGQGLNLQFADCVVNYDFPWNPMRIEQRIGRVDRVKQQSKLVKIFNFRTEGTVEEYVQIVLTSKLRECRSVLGEFTSPLQIEKIYEDKLTMGIGKALMEASNAEDMRKRMMKLGEDDLRRYIGDYSLYEEQAPPEWTWRPRD